jgi:hypothetical protein
VRRRRQRADIVRTLRDSVMAKGSQPDVVAGGSGEGGKVWPSVVVVCNVGRARLCYCLLAGRDPGK